MTTNIPAPVHPSRLSLTALFLKFLRFGVALAAAWRLKGMWVTPALVAGGAIAGWLVMP
ncbi:hypothetical protein [Sphingopyxis sp. NJF-3]